MRVPELVKRQWRFSKMLFCLFEFIFDEGYEVSFKVTYSKHNMRYAAYLIIRLSTGEMLSPEEYRKFGEFWERLGGTWGGRFGVRKEDYNKKVGWDPGYFQL